MTIEQMRHHHRAQPFQPFILHIADGGRVRIDHPEFLAFSPTGRTIMVGFPDGTIRAIDLLMVTQIEVPPTNGRHRRRRATPH